MFEQHAAFETPGSSETIRRYMDFTKFVSLLDRSALFFCRASKLGDPFEGTFPRPNYEVQRSPPEGVPEDTWRRFRQTLAHHTSFFRDATLVNSWHLGDHESAAMWKVYLKSDEGIAVKTTIQGLIESLEGFPDPVHLGKVRYIDFENSAIPEGNAFNPLIHKRLSFEHEREVRAVVSRWREMNEVLSGQREIEGAGEYIPVDLKKLVQSVEVAPTASDWFFELVSSMVDRFDLDAMVSKSVLDQDPIL